jgi:hypothetical protein
LEGDGFSWQSARKPKTVVLSDITSLAQLAVALTEHDPEAWMDDDSWKDEDGNIHWVKHRTEVILECDLQGRTLSIEDYDPHIHRSWLNILPGVKLRLLNGTIPLPDNAIIWVEKGALEMEHVTVTGRGAGAGYGLVNIFGKGAKGCLRRCTIIGPAKDDPYDLGCRFCHAVRVAEGADATLDRCLLSRATETGLFVEGSGSTAYAQSCIVEKCSSWGYAAQDGGRLTADRSVALGNERSGFYALRGTLEAVNGCRAENNGMSGFEAGRHSEVVVGAGCVASSNRGCGFYAYGSGADIQVAQGCTSEGNGGGDFGADKNARLTRSSA